MSADAERGKGRRVVDVADMRFDAPIERTDVPRSARLVGPSELGLNSRIDLYLHDGADEDGEEYAERVSTRFDAEMVARLAFEMEDYLCRIHGVISSSRASGEAEGILRRVLTGDERS